MSKLLDQIDGPADLKALSTTSSSSRWRRRSAS